MKSGIVKTW